MSSEERKWYEVIKIVMENYHACNYPEQVVTELMKQFSIELKSKPTKP